MVPYFFKTYDKISKFALYYKPAFMHVCVYMCASVSKEGGKEGRKRGRQRWRKEEEKWKYFMAPLGSPPWLYETSQQCSPKRAMVAVSLQLLLGFLQPFPFPSTGSPFFFPQCHHLRCPVIASILTSLSMPKKSSGRELREIGQRDENVMLKNSC